MFATYGYLICFTVAKAVGIILSVGSVQNASTVPRFFFDAKFVSGGSRKR